MRNRLEPSAERAEWPHVVIVGGGFGGSSRRGGAPATRARGPRLPLVATMTRMAESARSWFGAVERLGAGFLGRCLPSVAGPAYYLAGAPFFISQMRAELLGAGVSDLDIGIEMYGGY